MFEGSAPSLLGLRFSTALPFERWIEIGCTISGYHEASLWWLGDWLNHGQRMYGRRYKYGVAVTGLDAHTLRNYAMVARRFEMSRRRDKLSFHHHAELCALPTDEQDRWLDRAEQGAWTRNELRRRLHDERHSGEPIAALRVAIAVEPARRAAWLLAAEASGENLDAWIVSTLDTAASALLAERPRRTRLAGKAA